MGKLLFKIPKKFLILKNYTFKLKILKEKISNPILGAIQNNIITGYWYNDMNLSQIRFSE